MKTTAWKQIKNFLKDEEGATAVEYGVMVALIIAVIIATVVLIGDKILAAFQSVETQLPARPAA